MSLDANSKYRTSQFIKSFFPPRCGSHVIQLGVSLLTTSRLLTTAVTLGYAPSLVAAMVSDHSIQFSSLHGGVVCFNNRLTKNLCRWGN